MAILDGVRSRGHRAAMKNFLVTVVVLGLLFVGVGFVLPGSYEVERELIIEASAADVHPHISFPREWKKWSVWMQRDPLMEVEYTGTSSGPQSGMNWSSSRAGSGSLQITSSDPSQGVWVDITIKDGEAVRHVKGALTYKPLAGAVRVTWTWSGDLDEGALPRIKGLFLDGKLGPEFEANLVSLKRAVEGPR